MKIHAALSIVTVFVIVLLAFRLHEEQIQVNTAFNIIEYKKNNIVRCSPDWAQLKDWLEETSIPPIPGAGIYKWKISTKSDSAQFYFNQGINMYYSFHIIEAMASFKKATRFDPNSAMLYWAQALSYGPNINDFGYRASPEALSALNMAKELSSSASTFEKSLISAMTFRYTADSSDVTRVKLNQDYTDQMKKVYEKFPANPEAMALYADAMMLQHPWDLWNVDGTPKPWTPAIREVLEKLLAINPMHPGANHYYIHVMEPSPYADKALPSADRLGKTNPGLSHVVHMPSHIYLRTGNYQKGVDVNVNAVNSYKKAIPLYAPVTGADFLYIIHNLHMKTNHTMLAGQYKYSKESMEELINSIPADYLSLPGALGNLVQYIYMTPILVKIRFGDWGSIIEGPKSSSGMKYAGVLYHFGMGMAKVNKDFPIEDAEEELKQMEEYMKDPVLLEPFSPFSAAIEGAKVAHGILAGTIALKKKDFDKAITAINDAVVIEENMVYNEPRDWLLNPKHYLGNAYLVKGDGINAEKVFKQDMLTNKENGWALYGLYKALLVQKKNAEAASVLARYKTAFSKADIKLTAPVF